MIKIEKQIEKCTFCHLYNSDPSLSPLPGRGLSSSRFLIVGIAPGIGRINLPLLNRAMLMDDPRYPAYQLGRVLKEISWPISETYITNLIKCSLPNNREPMEKDITTCFKLFFLQELTYLMPKIIICLGKIPYDILVEKIGNNGNQKEHSFFPIEKVFHHSYIYRTPNKFEEWKNQWENLKIKYGIQ